MGDMLSFERGPDGVFDHAQSLDALWAEAEDLGRVGVEHAFTGAGYRAIVNFKTRSGSNVFAHGEGERPHDALRAAMVEARSLGAGRFGGRA